MVYFVVQISFAKGLIATTLCTLIILVASIQSYESYVMITLFPFTQFSGSPEGIFCRCYRRYKISLVDILIYLIYFTKYVL